MMASFLKLPKDITLLLLTVCTLVVLCASEPKLEIFPNQNPFLAATGTSMAVMCGGSSDEDGSFTEMKWFNPNGEEITEQNPAPVIVRKQSSSKLKLTFSEPKVEDSGTYRCTALFSNTVTLEEQIKIDFYDPIKFEDCPKVQNLVVGIEGRIKCRVVANPTPSINWEKKNQRIVQSDRIAIDESGIVISSVGLADAGTYTVEAFVKETGSNEILEIQVNVLNPPKINDLPEDFIVIQGEEYILTCGATGSPPLSYFWYDPSLRDLSQVDGYTVDNGKLTISKADRNARGEYTCKVKNPAGEDVATVIVEVQVRPSIIHLENITREENKDALFECKGEGEPKPQMSIRKDNSEKDVIDDPNNGMELEVTDEGPYKVLRLRIVNVKRSDDGLYYCKASNDAGVAERAGHLEVQFRPDMSRTQPTSVKTWSTNPANLSCIAEANPNATLSWRFQGEPIEQRDERFRIFGGVSYTNLLVMTENRPNNEVFGKYTCEARNALGESSIEITLDEATAPSQVTQIVFDKVTSTTITFRLMGPGNTGGMPITHYIMRYKLSDQPDTLRKEVEWPTGTPYILNNLIPRAKYQFSTAARNLVGIGTFKTEVYVMPEETVPEPPLIKTKQETVSRQPDSFEVSWDVPNDNGKPITKYAIRYFKVERGLKDWPQMEKAVEHSVDADILSFELTGLLPDSYYKIEIRAVNQIGNSLPESVVIKTSKGETNDGHTSLIGEDSIYPISIPIIVAIVIIALVITLIIIDITCFFRYHCGLLYLLRYRTCSRSPEKVPASMEEGRACVKEVSTANNGKIKSELKSPSSPDQLPPPPENGDPRPVDLIIDENFKNKSPKGSKSSIGKSSPV